MILKFIALLAQCTVEVKIMGLLDKVDNLDEKQPAKAKPKAAKAVAKAKPKAAKAKPKALKQNPPLDLQRLQKQQRQRIDQKKSGQQVCLKDMSWLARCQDTLGG